VNHKGVEQNRTDVLHQTECIDPVYFEQEPCDDPDETEDKKEGGYLRSRETIHQTQLPGDGKSRLNQPKVDDEYQDFENWRIIFTLHGRAI